MIDGIRSLLKDEPGAEIAKALFISQRTVETHLTLIHSELSIAEISEKLEISLYCGYGP